MVGTRIVVLQLKQLIRAGIIALIAIAAIVALIIFFTANKDKPVSAIYNPGTYSAQIILHNKPVSVKVTVNETEITNITLTELEEAQAVFYPLFKPTLDELAKEIIKKQTTNVNTQPNTEYTSKILLDAVNSALLRARIAPSE